MHYVNDDDHEMSRKDRFTSSMKPYVGLFYKWILIH